MPNHVNDRSSHRRCSVKKGFPKNLANFTGKHLCWSLFLIKLQAFRCIPVKFACVFLLTQVFSCEICQIFQNTYFEEHLQTTASKTKAMYASRYHGNGFAETRTLEQTIQQSTVGTNKSSILCSRLSLLSSLSSIIKIYYCFY